MGGLPLLALGFALLALTFGYRDYARGRPPLLTAGLLAGAAAAHAYVGLWAALSLTWFLHGSRRPGRTLGWLTWLAVLALGLSAFALLPWLAGGIGQLRTAPPRFRPTPLLEPRSWPLVAAAFLLVGLLAVVARARGGLDRRVLYAGHAGLVGLILPGLVPLIPEAPPLSFTGRGAAGAVGLAISAGSLAYLAWRAVRGEATNAARPSQMPRALTPAVLEMCPPPPPPRRWGSVVPFALLALLVALRFLAESAG